MKFRPDVKLVMITVFMTAGLFVVISADCYNSYSSSYYDDCDSWSSCSSSCGGGTRNRTCRQCYGSSISGSPWTEDESCNEICYYGNDFTNGSCNCSPYQTGNCCEMCIIPHCEPGFEECNYADSSFRCMQCNLNYFPVEQECIECPQIYVDHCLHRNCTDPYNTVCVHCQDDQYLFRVTGNGTKCDRMCAFNNHHCWPGTCGDLGMTKDCQCAPGFVKRELYGVTVNSGETSCQPDVKPVIQTCNTLFIGKDGMKKSSKNAGNQTACDILRDTYGNFQPISIEFKMISSFDVDLTNFMRPPFISKEKFGVTDTMLHIYKEVFKGSGVKENITSYIEHEDVSSSQNATSPVTNSGIIGVDSLTYNLGNGDALCVLYEAKGGGYLKTLDIRNTSIYTPYNEIIPYSKTSASSHHLCFRFDNIPPEHCKKLGTCTKEPLRIDERITRSGITRITFDGWTDPIPVGGTAVHASSVETYKISVHEVVSENGTQVVSPDSVFERIVNNHDTTLTLDLSSFPSMLYCVKLEVKDFAGNTRQARRFFLFDNISEIETQSDRAFLVTSALQQTDFTWQSDSNKICLNWTDHFFNRFYTDHNYLSPIEPDTENIIAEIYDETEGDLPINGTANINGILDYWVSWSVNNGSLSQEVKVTDFQTQRFCKEFAIVNGNRYTFQVRAVDIVGNSYSENRTVFVDKTAPEFRNIWLKKNGYKVLYTHVGIDMSLLNITFEAFDIHSGLKSVAWTLGLSNMSIELANGDLDIQKASEASCEIFPNQCYCPMTGDCEYFSYTIPLRGLILSSTDDYYFNITATNNAMLYYTEHVAFVLE